MSFDRDKYESIIKRVGGRNLKRIRTHAELSQEAMAKNIGVTERTVRSYELEATMLGQSQRLAVMDQLGRDPLSTEELFAEVKGDIPEPNEISFWERLRREDREIREKYYTRPARIMMDIRDQAYLGASFYFSAAIFAEKLSVPWGFKVQGVDWALLISLLLILTLFVPVISQIPLIKIIRHYLGRDD